MSAIDEQSRFAVQAGRALMGRDSWQGRGGNGAWRSGGLREALNKPRLK